jgi:hypothetical protein
MDYLGEAKKFIQRAQDASRPEVMKAHLEMADWWLSQAIEQDDGAASEDRKKSN